ncbi:MAG: CRISPR-associated protein Cas4 [Lachnospiraceae bacterium]|nr:CRISPR-associated protein Cas4 [Lachnospiraceae bacterium]
MSDNLIPLSYISQYNYCKRRAGLLLLEQQWNESVDTAKGRNEHENVHKQSNVKRGDIVVITDMTLTSDKLCLSGKSDAIEGIWSENGYEFPFLPNGKWQLYPIEYKHGTLRSEEEYELQLCAQAMCLEEKYNCNIRKGAIFFISSHRRCEVDFDNNKREKVKRTAEALQEMLISGMIPHEEYAPKCKKCSLKGICMPDINYSVSQYMNRVYHCFLEET